MCSGVLSLSSSQLMEAPSPPFIFQFLHKDSQFHTSYFAKSHFLLVEFQLYLPTSQAEFVGIQNGLRDIELNSDETRSPTFYVKKKCPQGIHPEFSATLLPPPHPGC